MGNELLASKIVIQEEQPRIRNIVGVPTAVTAAVGIAERGPVNVATEIVSFEDYLKIFGSYTANAQDLPLAVQGFFENGGSKMWVTRIVHYSPNIQSGTKDSAASTVNAQTAATSPIAGSVTSTGTPTFNLDAGDTLVINTDSLGNETATFDAAGATVTGVATETFALANGDSFTFDLQAPDGTQTVTFLTGEFSNIAAATAAEVCAVINAKTVGCTAVPSAGAIKITSDHQGTGSSIGSFANVSGTPVATLGLTGLSGSGTGDVADINAVTFSEIKTVVEADITNGSGVTVSQETGGEVTITSNKPGAGPSSSVQVDSSSTADTKIGFDNATHPGLSGAAVDTLQIDAKYDGTYGDDLTVEIATATSGVASEFNLTVLEAGAIAEIFSNVTMDDTASNFVETVVNDEATGSDLIQVTDLDVGVSPTLDRPDDGTVALTGGDDGLAGIDDNDYIGSVGTASGLRSFDTVNEIRLLIVPGKATSNVHNAMITYAETTRSGSMFCVFDPPAGQTASQIRTYVKTTANIKEASEFAAIYWPRIKISNPNKAVFGNTDTVVAPPSGHICGKMASNDAAQPGNVYEAPAGETFGDLKGALDVETDEVNDESKRDLVFPDLINPITNLEGEPVRIDGARTLCTTGPFPTIGERRGVIFIEQSLKQGLNFSRHRKIKRALLQQMYRSARTFMVTQTRNGAFASDDPATAFFLDFSEALNTASTAQARTTIGRVGIATAKPNEFVILRISQDQRALEEELALAA